MWGGVCEVITNADRPQPITVKFRASEDFWGPARINRAAICIQLGSTLLWRLPLKSTLLAVACLRPYTPPPPMFPKLKLDWTDFDTFDGTYRSLSIAATLCAEASWILSTPSFLEHYAIAYSGQHGFQHSRSHR